MFCVAADGDIDEYTDSVSAYISKCIDDVVPRVRVICFTLPNTLDPFQFAYRPNRSTDDAIALATHTTLSHLEIHNITYT